MFDWRHVMETAVEHDNQTHHNFFSLLILQDFSENFTMMQK